MNAGRFIGAAIGVWIVRSTLNGLFYTQTMSQQFEQIASAHPGITREVIPAYIVTDLVFALAFAFLFAKVGAALGGGTTAGMKLGLIVAILSPVVGDLYQYYSYTFLPVGFVTVDMIFQIVAHTVEGTVAGLIYKT